jgi:peptide-methionine (S)-S-oxide reductase
MPMRLLFPLAAVVISAACVQGSASGFDAAALLPPPALDSKPGGRSNEVAVFAGGCFWGVQGVYQHVKGVTSAVSGYAGGEEATAEYREVGSGRTGHAEAVRITFDPRVVTYGRLLQIFFSVVHDPTELNRQGPDEGPQYRSAIFPGSDEQAAIAKAYITQLTDARLFGAPIATTLEPGKVFFRAEDYHQDFLARNPTNSYIAAHDLPKLAQFKRLFPDLYRAKPILAGAE